MLTQRNGRVECERAELVVGTRRVHCAVGYVVVVVVDCSGRRCGCGHCGDEWLLLLLLLLLMLMMHVLAARAAADDRVARTDGRSIVATG